ncbi:MAG: hypothetical protein CMH53_09315 [Myxococcales bacterium]|nr:hypothetical protein [Myxococcales bacterium]
MQVHSELLLVGVFAGAVAIGCTVAIERLGGRIGGLIGTLPTTIVPASIGLFSATEGVGFEQAMGAVPVGMLINAIFLWTWRVLPSRLPNWSVRRRLILMVIGSLGLWSVIATLSVIAMRYVRSHALLVGGCATVVMASFGAWACRTHVPAPRGRRPVSAAQLLSRGVLAAIAIAAAVAVGDSGAELAAGVASVFPAIFLTTMTSLWMSQGEAVPSGAVGPMMLGSTSVSGYALIATWLFPWLGIGLGSALSWLLAVLFLTVPAWLWLTGSERR